MSNMPETILERYTPRISGRVPSLDGLRGVRFYWCCWDIRR